MIRTPPAIMLDPTAFADLRNGAGTNFSVLPAELVRLMPQYWVREMAAYHFNTDASPADGVTWMMQQSVVSDEAGSLAAFMVANHALLDPRRVGELLCDPARAALIQAYMVCLPLAGVSILDALRHFLRCVRLPSQANQIDRIMEAFGHRYRAANPAHPHLTSGDAVYVLSYALVMLATDLWGVPNADPNRVKMTNYDFRGVLEGQEGRAAMTNDFLDALYLEYVSFRARTHTHTAVLSVSRLRLS